MIVTDPVVIGWMKDHVAAVQFDGEKPKLMGLSLEIICGAIGAVIVVVWGQWLAKRQATRAEAAAANEASPPNS
jgi:hypothetical protein